MLFLLKINKIAENKMLIFFLNLLNVLNVRISLK